jgi:uncharacterized membrane protein
MRCRQGSAATKDVPHAVHSLLEATKTLQDKLRLWSIGKASETDVSDCYVAIGNEFNATINAFAVYDIELRYGEERVYIVIKF